MSVWLVKVSLENSVSRVGSVGFMRLQCIFEYNVICGYLAFQGFTFLLVMFGFIVCIICAYLVIIINYHTRLPNCVPFLNFSLVIAFFFFYFAIILWAIY